jgi:hypothetical protein
MEKALLQNLMAGAGSSSQFVGGLIVALLYVVIGLLSAIGSILVFRRIFRGRWEQIFWTSFLVVIAAFYLSFAAYFGASTHAWQTEVVGVVVFFFRCGWAVCPTCYRGWLCHAWALGSIPLSVWLFTCGPVDNRNSTGLRYLLLNVRFYGRVLSRDKCHCLARVGQVRPLLLATSSVISHSCSARSTATRKLVLLRIWPIATVRGFRLRFWLERLLLALSGYWLVRRTCPLSGVERT